MLHQFDYIFAIAMIFAFLDAWNIGANDVANSFASSVSSRSLKYWQAMILAGICEFLGAVLVGSRVSDTIRNKIVDVKLFADEPAMLMLTMTCALVGSSVWLTIATRIGMPVSTTHSIVGAVIGSSIAAKGTKNIIWGWNGVAQIIASWFIAPLIAGGFSSIIFLVSKYGVLEVKNPKTQVRNALALIPILVFAVFEILTMLIIYKGSPNLKLNKLSGHVTVAGILGTGAVALALYMLFCYPYYRRMLVHDDWTLKWYHIIRGPIYWFKSTDDIPPMPQGHRMYIDYYIGRRYDDNGNSIDEDGNLVVSRIDANGLRHRQNDKQASDISELEKQVGIDARYSEIDTASETFDLDRKNFLTTGKYWLALFKRPSKWPLLAWLVISHGFSQDIITSQASSGVLAGNLKSMHKSSRYYDNKIEFLYALLQAITAATMSFAHGANDIANATGPLAAVYMVWKTNTIASKSDVPVWVLCYAASALVIGCWTYGYRIMANLGNKLILQSPSRGFAIELGAAVTTVMATQLGIPISTTQSAVGATVFVGLCNKEIKAVNWRMVIWCYAGWIFTLPIAGIIAGVINGIVLNAPRPGVAYLSL